MSRWLCPSCKTPMIVLWGQAECPRCDYVMQVDGGRKQPMDLDALAKAMAAYKRTMEKVTR